MTLSLRLFHHESLSRVNGPGCRFVLWTQGCTLNCPGCFNPETHPLKGGYRLSLDLLIAEILSNRDSIEGITLSGGEPLLQSRALSLFLTRIKHESNLSTLLFTGFEWAELQKIAAIDTILSHLDLLISGRYLQSQRLASHLIGSSNKTVHFLSSRYNQTDLNIEAAEVTIANDGTITLTGIDPFKWE
jgi:anaerobic ribonucleoside-triphosphate reductase activating protein